MLAFLKLISPKEWLLVAALAALGAYTAYIFHDGEVRIEKKNAALRAAAVALNTAAEGLANIKEIQIETQYKYIVDSAPVADTGLVCHNAAPEQPSAAESTGSANPAAPDVLPSGNFDPSGATLTLLRAADAQVNALLDRNAELEAELEGATK